METSPTKLLSIIFYSVNCQGRHDLIGCCNTRPEPWQKPTSQFGCFLDDFAVGLQENCCPAYSMAAGCPCFSEVGKIAPSINREQWYVFCQHCDICNTATVSITADCRNGRVLHVMKVARAEGARKSVKKYFIGLIETIRCFQGNARILPARKVFYSPLFSSKSLVGFVETWWL